MVHRWYLQDHEETFLSVANGSQFLEVMRKYEASTTSVHRDIRQKQERLQEGSLLFCSSLLIIFTRNKN